MYIYIYISARRWVLVLVMGGGGYVVKQRRSDMNC